MAAQGAASYEWWRDDNTKIVGAISDSYTFTPTLTDGNHYYRALAIGPDASVSASNNAWLYVAARTDQATVQNVEYFGTVSAAQVADSFGLGVDSNQDWEFAAVAGIGGKWVRADGCQWEKVEVQNLPDNTSGGFSFASAPGCVQEVASAAQYGLHLDNVAYWAPPAGQVATATVSVTAPAGASTIPITLNGGSFAQYPARDLIVLDNSHIGALNARIDGATPIEGTDGTVFTLPEPTVKDLPAGTSLSVGVLLYPPVMIDPSTSPTAYLNNASVQAWTRYIGAVESYIASQGVTGTVELWNEPEQSGELWDHPTSYYASPPDHWEADGTGRYLAEAAATLPAVPGIKLINGWSGTSGSSCLFCPPFGTAMPASPAVVQNVFASDAFHVYGYEPEQLAWLPTPLAQDAAANAESLQAESPIGSQAGSNMKSAPFYDLQPYAQGGIGMSVTEGGAGITGAPGETAEERTRFNVREFLNMAALGVHPIIFYKAGNDSEFEWFGEDPAHTPALVATTFQAMMADIRSIGQPAITDVTQQPLPTVANYTGYYPLSTSSFVGSRAGDRANSILFFTYQKSFTLPVTTEGGSGNLVQQQWLTMPSPPAVPLILTLPAGFNVSMIKDVVTGAQVQYSLTGQTLSYSVADDPIEVLLTPTSSYTLSVTVAPGSLAYSTTSTNLSATVSFTGPTAPSGAVTFAVGPNTTVTAVCNGLTATRESCTATYPTMNLQPGSYTITATVAPDATYNTVTATSSLTVSPASLTMVITPVTASLDTTVALVQTSLVFAGSTRPTAAVTIQASPDSSIVAMTCSGSASPLVCTGSYPLAGLSAGTTTLVATFAGDEDYGPATATGLLTLAPADSTITVSDAQVVFGTVRTTLEAAVSFTASQTPTGNLLFTVAGLTPVAATCSGSTSPLHCMATVVTTTLPAGTYSIIAELGEDPRFRSAQGNGTLQITPATPVLTIAPAQAILGASTVTMTTTITWTGSYAPTGLLTLAIDDGSAVRASCAFTSSPSLCTATLPIASRPVGKYAVTARLAADSNDAAASAVGTLELVQTSKIWVGDQRGLIGAFQESGAIDGGLTQITGAYALAVDSTGAVWSVGVGGASKLALDGSVLHSGLTLGGIHQPTALGLDGADAVWMTNADNTISALNADGAPITPFGYVCGCAGATSIHPDSAGSLWITNAGDDSITEVIGIAYPKT